MIRKIITIDEDKCNGCGICAEACHEDAIGIIDGKARLLRDDYCDGLGDCLPTCPTGAISFTEREALAFNKEEVEKNMAVKKAAQEASGEPAAAAPVESQLRQWPVQIKLVAPNAAFFDGADLLIAADCVPFAYGDFHNSFMKNRVPIVGCPKLDSVDYSEKLTEILKNNDIKSVTVVKMEVPCCGGMEYAAKQALENSGKFIPSQVITITTDGKILR
jgi:NAD-dependent dihydropyrimidine dehydrogenase PreA subunit